MSELVWTNEAPAERGQYWVWAYRTMPEESAFVVSVDLRSGVAHILTPQGWAPVAAARYKWAGPIPLPVAAKVTVAA